MQLLNRHWEANKQARQKERWSTGVRSRAI